jgi:hypothetical protein
VYYLHAAVSAGVLTSAGGNGNGVTVELAIMTPTIPPFSERRSWGQFIPPPSGFVGTPPVGAAQATISVSVLLPMSQNDTAFVQLGASSQTGSIDPTFSIGGLGLSEFDGFLVSPAP